MTPVPGGQFRHFRGGSFDPSGLRPLVYVGAISLCLGLLVWHGLAGQSDFAVVSKDFADLIKTAVVPIVTLVLGYYFGRSGRT
jgi:hypothetical protein